MIQSHMTQKKPNVAFNVENRTEIIGTYKDICFMSYFCKGDYDILMCILMFQIPSKSICSAESLKCDLKWQTWWKENMMHMTLLF